MYMKVKWIIQNYCNFKNCSSFVVDKRLIMNITDFITRTGGFMSSTEAIKSTFSNRETSFRANHPLFTEDFFIAKDR